MIGSRGDQKAWLCNVLRNSALHSNPVNTSVSQAGSMVTRVDARMGREGLTEEQQVSQREGEESVATRQSLFAGAGSMARRPDVTTSTAPGYRIIVVAQNRSDHASARLPKPLACCPQISPSCTYEAPSVLYSYEVTLYKVGISALRNQTGPLFQMLTSELQGREGGQ